MRVIGKGSLASFVMGLINIGWHATTILLALAVCLLAISPWVDPPRVAVDFAVPVALGLDPETHHFTSSSLAVENVQLADARGSLRFSPRSRAVVAASAVVLIVVLTLIKWVFGELRAVFHTLRAGHPFVAANAGRLRRIGYAVIVGEFARALLAFAGMYYAMTHFAIEGVRFEITNRDQLDATRLGLEVAAAMRAGVSLQPVMVSSGG
jgi:hypothetical protein